MTTMRAMQQHFTRNLNGLSFTEIREKAPSVFAEGAHESRTDKYTIIPTSKILEGLLTVDFVPVEVKQASPRDESRHGFAKHMICLRHRSTLGYGVPETCMFLLTNSFDGSSAYIIDIGYWRQVCTNGMVVWNGVAELRIPHRGDIVTRVVEGTLETATRAEQVIDSVKQMKSIQLPEWQQIKLAKYAIKARFDTEEEPAAPHDTIALPQEQEQKKGTTYRPEAFLEPRRMADTGNDLWTKFNIVQEYGMKGGATGTDSKGKERKSRPVHGIDQTLKFNRLIWGFAEELRKYNS